MTLKLIWVAFCRGTRDYLDMALTGWLSVKILDHGAGGLDSPLASVIKSPEVHRHKLVPILI